LFLEIFRWLSRRQIKKKLNSGKSKIFWQKQRLKKNPFLLYKPLGGFWGRQKRKQIKILQEENLLEKSMIYEKSFFLLLVFSGHLGRANKRKTRFCQS